MQSQRNPITNNCTLRLRASDLYSTAACIATSLLVFAGTIIGYDHFLHSSPTSASQMGIPLRLANWDGYAYSKIVEEGYSYQPDQGSNVAFFPLFPLLAAIVKWMLTCQTEVALIIVAFVSLLLSYICISRYLQHSDRLSVKEGDLAILALGLWPTGVFFRLAYSESTFLLFIVLTMYGIQCRWRPIWIAIAIGIATGTRFVGIALLLPFLCYLWDFPCSRLRFWLTLTPLVTLSLSGLLAFMLFQLFEFGDALAFAKTQADWGKQASQVTLAEAGSLLIGKPLWSTYVPGSAVSWMAHDNVYVNPLFSLNFANPIFWLLAWLLVAIGAYRRWLTRYEILLSVGLLLIPYLTVASMNGMRSQGRYAAVVFPCYLVLGKLLAGMDPATRTLVYCGSAILLFIYAAMFVAQYSIF